MKLVNVDYQLEILLKENEVNILVVENPYAYTSLVQSIWKQCEGINGKWILSKQDISLNIPKSMKCIINPFSININEKSIITKLYQELKYLSDENFLIESNHLNSQIVQFIDQLTNSTSYPLIFNTDYNVTNLLKLYDVKLDTTGDSFLERIVEYLKVMNQICHINIFVFVGIKQYLSEEELQQLYEFIFYEKIYLILFESKQYKILDNENIFIIDKDLCIIDIESNN